MFNKVLKSLLLMLITFSVYAVDTVKIDTAKGEVNVPINPLKVAVFDLGVLENMEVLGVDAGAVINKLYSDKKEAKYKDTPRVGSLFEPNIEKLIAYNPDLIIIAARTAKHLDALNKIAPTIDMSVQSGNFLDNSKKSFVELAKVFDKSSEAKAISTRIDEKVTALKALTKDNGKGLFVLTMGPKVSAFGKGSRFGWIHDDLGVAEAIKNVKETTHGEPISFEFIKEANPDWLIVFDRAAAIGKNIDSAKIVLGNALVAETPAWKKQQVIYVSPATYLAIGGMDNIEKTIDTFSEAFKKAQ